MRKYALLDNNVIVEIMDLDDDSYVVQAALHQLVVDIQDLVVPPQIGWLLNGNVLTPPPGQTINLKEMIKARIKFYQESAGELLRDLYATNTLLGLTVAQSDQMFQDYSDVLMRIREGAWPTAVYRLSIKEPSGFVTQEMLDNWSNLIQSRII